MTTMHYPYKPIDPATETRVLRFDGDSSAEDGQIRCSLVHTSLSSPVPYEALSYVWKNAVVGSLNGYDPAAMDEWGNLPVALASAAGTVIAKVNDSVHNTSLKCILYSNGMPRQDETITIDGIEVKVGGELYSALLRLRKLWQNDTQDPSERLAVWIDALSINQNDVQERNKHVSKMSEIYSKAKTVRIWLGEVLSETDRVAMEDLYPLYDFMRDKWKIDEHQGQKVPAVEDLHWNALNSLINRAWFRRTWVIQEVGLASSAIMHLGPYTIDWELLQVIILGLRRFGMDRYFLAYTGYTATSAILLMSRLSTRTKDPTSSFNKENPLTLLEILRDSRNFQCTIPSDKIYGVLALAEDKDKYPAPDYSFRAEEVFASIAKSHIMNYDSLEMLYHCSKSDETLSSSLPSWVPDWTQKCFHEPMYLKRMHCRASGDLTPSYEFHGNTLIVRGRPLEMIEQIESIRWIPHNERRVTSGPKPIIRENGEEVKVHSDVDRFEKLPMRFLQEQGDNRRASYKNILTIAFPNKVMDASRFEALWRTFICNHTDKGETAPQEWGAYFADFLTSMIGPQKENHKREESSKFDLTERFEQHTRAPSTGSQWFSSVHAPMCYNRRFFMTNAGKFGWGPSGIKEGDMITVVDGLAVPLVLRPQAENYEVVGDCYTHGLMNGEALESGVDSIELHLV